MNDSTPVSNGNESGASRRAFLAAACAVPVGAALASSAPAAAPQPILPQVQLGKHSISRLVCGANPFNAGSHLSCFVNNAMRAYYTPEQIIKTLRRCQTVGINTWQSGPGNLELYKRFRDEGGQMNFISLGENGYGKCPPPAELGKAGAIAVAHHGELSDQYFKKGTPEKIGDYIKSVKDAGLLAGVSTHMPAVVQHVEEKGWPVDFYMTCVYQRHRSAEELKQYLGHVPIPVGEVYLQDDPPRMYEVVRQTKRTCLAFKILAAGRLSDRKNWVEQAFKEAYEGIKPTDSVIIGIWDQYSDQPAECAELVKKYAR